MRMRMLVSAIVVVLMCGLANAGNIKASALIADDKVIIVLSENGTHGRGYFNSGNLNVDSVTFSEHYAVCYRDGEDNLLYGDYLDWGSPTDNSTEKMLANVRSECKTQSAWLSPITELNIHVSGLYNDIVTIDLPNMQYRLVWRKDGSSNRSAWSTSFFSLGLAKAALHPAKSEVPYYGVRRVAIPDKLYVGWIGHGKIWNGQISALKYYGALPAFIVNCNA